MPRQNPLPDGGDSVRGDTGAIPDRGTGTGFNGDTYGADTSPEATNRISGIRGATRSDAPFESDNDSGMKDGDE